MKGKKKRGGESVLGTDGPDTGICCRNIWRLCSLEAKVETAHASEKVPFGQCH